MANLADERITLERIVNALLGNTDLAELWWNSPNRAFGGNTPNNTPLETVSKYLHSHAFGDYS